MKFILKSNLKSAFTLLEIIVAVAVLSVMVSFMFSILTASLTMWKTGNKGIEASRVAAIGLNIISKDLSQAVAGSFTFQFQSPAGATSPTTSKNIIIPFEAISNPTHTINMGGSSVNAAGSQQLRAIVSTTDTNSPYKEIGLMCVRLGANYGPMQAKKYYLVMKDLNSAVFNTGGAAWTYSNGNYVNFIPIADNCIRLKIDYALEPFSWDTNTGSWENTTGLIFTTAWPNNNTLEFPDKSARTASPPTAPMGITSYNRLAGVLLSITLIDADTMEKIEAVNNGAALTQEEIDASDPDSTPSTPVEKLVKSGASTIRRFVPFNPPQY
jgi:prepilin-type N-terminal cleavage/methylation domain-containing protein